MAMIYSDKIYNFSELVACDNAQIPFGIVSGDWGKVCSPTSVTAGKKCLGAHRDTAFQFVNVMTFTLLANFYLRLELIPSKPRREINSAISLTLHLSSEHSHS